MNPSPKEIRLTAGMSIERAAVAAGVTSPTLRLFEANPNAPSRASRAKLESFYQRLAAKLSASPNPDAPQAA